MTWQDSTAQIVDYLQQTRRHLGPLETEAVGSWRSWVRITTGAYLATLDEHGGRTGLVLAERRPAT